MSKICSQTMCIAILLCTFLLPLSLKASNEKAWIDLPEPSLVDLGSGNLPKLVSSYHEINKTDLKLLPWRISTLGSIIEEIENISAQASETYTRTLEKISVISTRKKWYLEKLKELYDGCAAEPNYVRDILGMNDDSFPNQIPLFNKVLYDFKLPSYWGLYWLEAVDPCHRLMLTPYYLTWKKKGKGIPFFLWLEYQGIPFYSPQVEYLNEDRLELQKVKISQSDHLAYDQQETKLTCNAPGVEYLYVLSASKKLYVIAGNDKVRHSTLSHGFPVLGAGSIKFENGNLTYIDIESGHYQPTDYDLYLIIRTLKDLGLALDPQSVNVRYYLDGKSIRETLASFLGKKHLKKRENEQKIEEEKQLFQLI